LTSLIAFIGFAIATVIHGFYDYFLLTSFMPGIWIMAFISLSIAVLFAQKAMTLHQDASPFKKTE
jgi:RsiW-degrading membrane proteinase PrsW (M82 family)